MKILYPKVTTFFVVLLITNTLISMDSPHASRFNSNSNGKVETVEQLDHIKKDGSPFCNLVSDDVAIPTCWTENPIPAPETIPQGFFIENQQCTIRKRQFYRPNNVAQDSNALIVFVVVHGTWGIKTADYFNDEDDKPNMQNYRHIKRFASFLSTIKKSNLELLSYAWSGVLSTDKRTIAAQHLQRLFTEIKSYKNAEKVILAHSHGCNVANLLSRLTPPERPISLLILFACPRRPEKEYQPQHYKTLLYFHSDSDWTTVAGGIPESKLKTEAVVTGSCLTSFALATASCVYLATRSKEKDDRNDALKTGGLLLIVTGTMVARAVNTFKQADNTFPTNLPELNDKLTVGFRVKINGSNPGHAGVTDIVRFLPEILEKMLTKYPANYTGSSKFHLNIDTKQNPQSMQDPVFIVLEPCILATRPQYVDNFVLNSQNNILDTDTIPRSADRAEKDYSLQEALRYLASHNQKDITKSYPLSLK